MEFIIVVTFLAFTYFLFKQKRASLIEKNGFRKATAEEKKPNAANKAFQCVSIQPGMNACHSAKILDGTPILMNDAVPLPLNACDVQKCSCQFLRYDDRRRGERRHNLHIAQQIMVDVNNHRAQSDRRRTQAD